MAKRRALIIGGSLGGLFAAHQLRLIGWDVDVFERASDNLADRGAGIGTHRALSTIMQHFGPGFDDSSRTTPQSYICLDRDNRRIHAMPMRRAMTAWSRLYRPLKDDLPLQNYHGSKLLTGLHTDDRSATAIFADGSHITADLLIGADGLRSTVRAQMLPHLKPAYAGYIAWRALIPEGELPPATWAAIREHYVFCVPEGELLVSYPVPTREADIAKGRLSYNVVWYRPADDALLADLCTDGEGRLHAISIPPPLIRADVVASMKACARSLLAPPIADVIERTQQPLFQPIYDLASPRVIFGRVALLGDAAFVARPHVGAGVTKAALDALCLAQAIGSSGDLGEALDRYDRQRRQLGDWLVARGRSMGAMIKTRAKSEHAPDEPELHRRSRLIMHEYITVAADIEKRTASQDPTVGGA
jgi:2-polyprenyl-6-methoxyphenol hydroxylase-like FAD-dependent oxidoreductase